MVGMDYFFSNEWTFKVEKYGLVVWLEHQKMKKKYWFTSQNWYWDSMYDVLWNDKLKWGIFSLKILII